MVPFRIKVDFPTPPAPTTAIVTSRSSLSVALLFAVTLEAIDPLRARAAEYAVLVLLEPDRCCMDAVASNRRGGSRGLSGGVLTALWLAAALSWGKRGGTRNSSVGRRIKRSAEGIGRVAQAVPSRSDTSEFALLGRRLGSLGRPRKSDVEPERDPL